MINFRFILKIALLSLIIINCNQDSPNISSNKIEEIKTNQIIELKSIYYQNNIDRSKHIDSLNFNWSADDLLGNNFDLDPHGKFGQKAYFSTTIEGKYDIALKVKHKWTGEILNTETFSFKATKDEKKIFTTKHTNPDYDISHEKEITKNIESDKKIDNNVELSDSIFFIQISAWESIDKADKEIDLLKSLGYAPFIEQSGKWFRVRVGAYASIVEAQNKANEISSNLVRDPWIFKKEIQTEDKPVEVENLINYEIEVENLIDYEEEASPKSIEVENLIDYEEELTENTLIQNNIYIQVSTWKSKADAENELKNIELIGYTPFILEFLDKNNQTWYKVRLGPLSEEESILIKSNLSKALNKRVRIVK